MTPRISVVADSPDLAFARAILPLVSRTFASAIEILPTSLRDPVRLAYLLCRVADTIEDLPSAPSSQRRDWLNRFSLILSSPPIARDPEIATLAGEIRSVLREGAPDAALAEGMPRLFRLLRSTDQDQRASIQRWTIEMSMGMAQFIEMEEGHSGWTSLPTVEDLVAYEYCVAGTVGSLLDELFIAATPDALHGMPHRRRLAVALGLGLQGTNILQDLADDRARGWSYLPEEIAHRHGTDTRRLHEPSEQEAAMSAIAEMARLAATDLDLGFEYILMLPARQVRIRLFCLWPLLLAVRTLSRISRDPEVLQRRLRITREEVAELIRESSRRCRFNDKLSVLYKMERDRLDAVLSFRPGPIHLHKEGA